MQAEELLVRHLVKLNIDQGTTKKIQEILSPDLNWAYFLQKTKDERVCSLIYKALSKIQDAEKILPENILQDLRNIYYSTAKRNILIFQTLQEILQAFKKKGIRTIVFKGIVLAESVYGDIAARSMSDLDILINRQDIKRADKVLEDFNYTRPFGVKDFSKVSFNLYRNSILYKNFNGYPKYIHLYWHILNLCPYDKDILQKIDMDKIWREAVDINLGGIKTRTFSLCHQLIYLCMHALNDSFRSLILLCDINEFLRINKETLNWSKLIEEAYLFGLSKYTYYSLYVVSIFFGVYIPEFVFKRLKPKRISCFEQRFISSVLKRKTTDMDQCFAFLGMNETLKDRVLFLSKALFPTRDEFGFIRQKDPNQINCLDYLRRFKIAFNRK